MRVGGLQRLQRGQRRVELLLLEPLSAQTADATRWRVMYRTSKPLRPQSSLRVLDRQGEPIPGQTLIVSSVEGEGRAVIDFPTDVPLGPLLDQAGELPLPPYIVKQRQHSGLPAQPDDQERYQTVYARAEGSVAAPTAGLHLDREQLARLDVVELLLHVGPGTFLPMDVADVSLHRVGAERVTLTPAAAERIAAARAAGRPIVAVGTTTTRALEGIAARHDGRLLPTDDATSLVITPGFRFRVVTHLLTNFHLPRSSLLMLVCALAGRSRVLSWYREAVQEGYRFYSYGDCMLVGREPREPRAAPNEDP